LQARLWHRDEPEQTISYRGLILISHGFSGHARSLERYASALARTGYLVTAVDHDDLKGLRDGQGHNDPLIARSRHIELTLQYLRDSGYINKGTPIGTLGYSMGAFSVMLASGFSVDFSAHKQACVKQSAADNMILCNPRMQKRINKLVGFTLAPAVVAQENPIQAIAILSPSYLDLIDFTNHITIPPILLVASEHDEYIHYPISVVNWP